MKQYLFSFCHGCIGYVLIKLKYYYNVTSYKSFINKIYDLMGQTSFVVFKSIRSVCLCYIPFYITFIYTSGLFIPD